MVRNTSTVRRAVRFALATGFTSMAFAAGALAQDAATPADEEMQEIVVTAVAAPREALAASVSTTDVSLDEILQFTPRNTAEIFRNLPGIRAESSGGEGNANLTVRGVPIASGGAKYVQLWEDGLPVMEFGDIAFGNADIFLRNDYTLERVEAIRGGSASTFASNSPAGVINFISRTGREAGGQIGASFGVDYDDFRTDFAYGSPISETLRFHVGGFFRQGEGPRDPGYSGNSGGQIKANLTKEFDRGHVRLYFKHLDDRAVSYLPMPVSATGTNGSPALGGVPGYDSGSETLQSAYFLSDVGVDGDGNRRRTDIRRGMNPRSTVFGAEASFELDGGWTVTNRLRHASTDGLFVSPFPAEVGAAQGIANSTVDLLTGSTGATGARLTYANGPRAGQAFNNANGLAQRIHLFNVELNDLGNFANDFKLSKSLGDNATVTAGYYVAQQNIDLSWQWNSYLMEVRGDDAALLNLATSAGAPLSQNGLYAYGVPFWGNCCTRNYDATYDIRAPYLSLAFTAGPVEADVSVRRDSGDARGTYGGPRQAAFDVSGDGVIQAPEQSVSVVDNANLSPINYGWRYTSYSAGASWRLAPGSAVFGRVSRGARANADRLLFTPFVRADGTAVPGLSADRITQVEAGWKWRAAGYRLNVTAFHTETQEQANFEATTQRLISQDYEARGIEVEALAAWGDFTLSGNLTWTDAEITSGTFDGNTPRRQPDLLYTLTPTWRKGRVTLGGNFVGVTDSYAQDGNELKMPGYLQVNAFAEARVTDALTVSLNVNNLTDEFAITEAEDGTLNANGLIRARPINPRTTSLTLRYAF
jgi:outer membrane receptor protein involved in Fe transport